MNYSYVISSYLQHEEATKVIHLFIVIWDLW